MLSIIVIILIIISTIWLIFYGKDTLKSFKLYLVVMSMRKPLPWLGFLRPTIKEEVTLKSKNRILKPDLYYLPVTRKMPAMIVYCPLAVEGKKNGPIINFMKGLTRLGFVTIVPYWPNRRLGQIHSNDVEEVRSVIDFIHHHPRVDNSKITLIGISYGIGPVLKAISNLQYQKKIKGVISVGGFADLEDLFKFTLTGKFKINHDIVKVKTDPYGKYILLRTIAQFIKNRPDRELINRFLDQAKIKQDLDFKQLLNQISLQSKNLLTNIFIKPNPKFALLPLGVKKIFRDLSVTTFASKVKTTLLILHSTRDRIVPYSQSLILERLFKNRGGKLYLINAFDHAIPRQVNWTNFLSVYLSNLFRMVRFLYDVIRLSS